MNPNQPNSVPPQSPQQPSPPLPSPPEMVSPQLPEPTPPPQASPQVIQPSDPNLQPTTPSQPENPQVFGMPAPQAPIPPPTNTQQPFTDITQPVPGNQYMSSPQMSGSGKSKKKFIIGGIISGVVIVAAAFLFLGGGAEKIANKVTGLELESYTNEGFKFSILAPKGWEVEETDETYAKDVVFTEPVGDVTDDSESSLHYSRVRVDYDVADQKYMEKKEQEYFNDLKKGLQQLATRDNSSNATESYTPEVMEVESGEAVTVNGLNAYKVKLKVTNYDGEKDSVGYEYGLFVFVDKKNQYQISIRAHKSDTDIQDKVDEIFNSFVHT